ncbi:NADH-quinone oxidoreductase subunit NuoN [Sulfolobus acidocaldarius]|uniref:NADH:ubiquinone oxidoreductase subunit N n=3 Tax=Sulfolobus acidocaldarius TaxID=2285 RepID=A0A0U3HCI3_9CREN|nr:NADH-quinone oxidoreductase subunit NuoN [Sulfolobus acidocaldarius]AGE72223.1 NADH:ubiquinone oxidoreductase subunit N [Sulfolobus acidocaldarius N8]AGE74540.1 NADH:ubiquinone oxidoreductase subunit N [Sulfolobus acidocaldarius Ron12/I]ALU29610.1 NADH:ubiquinone oxidoreductase subunit N [Sulfolobus acidocaldarius]ALU32343.1 NADH:ubiquinone oxidoreductase subunit N [Sulfolobus acidocaldarius]WCM33987.1 NADH-quinone oxidoreductase subunit NuoN [Sulfolobus acidocaldarius DSM 639]
MLSEYLPIIIPSVFLVIPSIAILYMEKRFSTAVYTAVIGLLISFLSFTLFFSLGYYNYGVFNNALYLTKFGYFIAISSLIATILVVLGSSNDLKNWETGTSFLSLSLLTNIGVIYLAFAYNVLVIFASWAIASAATYVIAMLKKDYQSVEAGVKYLVMGLLSSSLMIIGLAFFVTAGNTLYLDPVISYQPLIVLSIIFFSIAFLFKIGAFPFQGWLPEVYSLADRFSVGFVSSVGKIVGIEPLLVILYYLIQDNSSSQVIYLTVVILFSIISVLSLIFGNISAFSRKDFAQILAYSSITQVGFMVIGIAMLPVNMNIAISGLMVYLLSYSIAQAGLFVSLSHVEKITGSSYFESFRGMSSGDRVLAFSMTILLLSLLGIPPILGFWAKLFVLESSFSQPWLTIIGFINSAISAGYYIPPIREIFREGQFKKVDSPERDSVIVAAVLSIALGIISPLIFGVLV